MTAERDLLDEGWLCRTIADETGCKDDERVLDAARAIVTRLRAREARVQALVEAADEALALLREYVQGEETAADRLEAALDALGKEGA